LMLSGVSFGSNWAPLGSQFFLDIFCLVFFGNFFVLDCTNRLKQTFDLISLQIA